MPTTYRSLREPEERVGQCSNAALPPPHLSEAAIVQRVRMRDDATIRFLYERYSTALHHVALKFVHRVEEAEEVVQQTWMAVLTGIDRFEARSSFKTWLFRILINRARSRAKREARVVPFADLSKAEHRKIQHAAAAEHAESDPALQNLLQAAVAELPHLQRHVITMRDIEGRSAGDVCEALDVSVVNQRVALHRARMRVRARLEQYRNAA